MTDVDNGISDVAAVKWDGAIDVSEGTPTAELVAVGICDGASCCVSNEGPGGGSVGAVLTYRTRASRTTCLITVLPPHPSPHRLYHPRCCSPRIGPSPRSSSLSRP